MLCNLSHRTIDDRAKREKCIVLLRALQFCSQLNARRSTMQSVWSDLSKTETRRLHLTSHPCYNMKQAMCSQGHRSLSLPVSLAHRTTLLIYCKRGGFDVGLCVPISTLLWQEGARRPVIGCLQQAGRLRSDWLLLLCVCVRARDAHSRWQPQGTVRSQWESAFCRRGQNTTGGAYALYLSAHYGFMWWLNIIQQAIMLTFIVR